MHPFVSNALTGGLDFRREMYHVTTTKLGPCWLVFVGDVFTVNTAERLGSFILKAGNGLRQGRPVALGRRHATSRARPRQPGRGAVAAVRCGVCRGICCGVVRVVWSGACGVGLLAVDPLMMLLWPPPPPSLLAFFGLI